MNTHTTDRIVRYSILLALDRHNWSKQMRFGIYLDDGSRDFVVHHNVCWGGGTAFHVGNNGHSSTDHQIYNGGKPDIGAYEYGLPHGGWKFYPPGARGKVGAPEGRQESKPLNR